MQSSLLKSARLLTQKNGLSPLVASIQARNYATHEDVDLVVIGSGPGGYVGAIKAAQLGKRNPLDTVIDAKLILPLFVRYEDSVCRKECHSWRNLSQCWMHSKQSSSQ